MHIFAFFCMLKADFDIKCFKLFLFVFICCYLFFLFFLFFFVFFVFFKSLFSCAGKASFLKEKMKPTMSYDISGKPQVII